MKSPGGYVPSEIKARPKKRWDQGLSMDTEKLPPSRLDDFDYAITTRAGYQSTPPANFKPVAHTASFVLWKRTGPTPLLQIIDKPGTPGRILACPDGPNHGLAGRQGTATVLDRPVVRHQPAWSPTWHIDAPGTATTQMRLPRGHWELSLSYDSQVSLVVSAGGRSFTLPPSLDGMYLSAQGEASYWRAGTLRSQGERVKVTVSAKEPSSFQRLFDVRRQVWLGSIAATRGGPATITLHDTCNRFVDHFIVRGGRSRSETASSGG